METTEFKEALEDFVSTVTRKEPKAVVILAAPIPWFDDNTNMVGKCVTAGKSVRALCNRSDRLVFSKLAEEFYTRVGVNLSVCNAQGLTQAGMLAVQRNVKAKLVDPKVKSCLAVVSQ